MVREVNQEMVQKDQSWACKQKPNALFFSSHITLPCPAASVPNKGTKHTFTEHLAAAGARVARHEPHPAAGIYRVAPPYRGVWSRVAGPEGRRHLPGLVQAVDLLGATQVRVVREHVLDQTRRVKTFN